MFKTSQLLSPRASQKPNNNKNLLRDHKRIFAMADQVEE